MYVWMDGWTDILMYDGWMDGGREGGKEREGGREGGRDEWMEGGRESTAFRDTKFSFV